MQLKRIMPLLVLAALTCIPSSAFIQDVEIIDIPLLYEIDGHPDYGFFSDIHSISIDENRRAVFVLHDTPAMLSAFSIDNGNPLQKTDLATRVDAPASAEICNQSTWMVVDRKLMALEKDGTMKPPVLRESPDPIEADFARCSPFDDLFIADAKKKKLYLVPRGKMLLPVDGSQIAGQKQPSPEKLFASITDIAFGGMNNIFVLDRKGGVIRSIDNSGRLLGSHILAAPSGAQMPWEVSSIAVDAQDRIWAVNVTENSLDIYDSFGTLEFRIRDFNDETMEYRFTRPVKILIDRDNRVYVVDQGMMKIRVFDANSLQE